MAAGLTGMNDAREGRPVELNPATTIGGMRQAETDRAQKEAQNEFKNSQAADELTLQKHRDALAQQNAVQSAYKDSVLMHDADIRAQIAGQNGAASLINSEGNQEKLYANYMSLSGSKLVTGPDGQAVGFPGYVEGAAAMKQYALQNPSVIHGSSASNAKFGVIPAWDGTQWRLIDLPANKNNKVIDHAGQATDPDGKPLSNPDGTPKLDMKHPFFGIGPDGNLVQTVSTQPITPQQLMDSQSKVFQEANASSEIHNRRVQEARSKTKDQADQDTKTAEALYQEGDFDTMTPRQKLIATGYARRDIRTAFQKKTDAQKALTSYLQAAYQVKSLNDPALLPADQKKIENSAEYKDFVSAAAEQDGAYENYSKLTGVTPGISKAMGLLHGQDINNLVWSNPQGTGVQDQIMNDPNLSPEEKQTAKNYAWRQLPAQKRAVITANRGGAANPSPAGMVSVQIPGHPVGHIPQANLQKFLKDHPDAVQLRQ
ncbi:MAG: hypothetical protein ACYC93_05480 [Candidatus Acidiferrales bacterium]